MAGARFLSFIFSLLWLLGIPSHLEGGAHSGGELMLPGNVRVLLRGSKSWQGSEQLFTVQEMKVDICTHFSLFMLTWILFGAPCSLTYLGNKSTLLMFVYLQCHRKLASRSHY